MPTDANPCEQVGNHLLLKIVACFFFFSCKPSRGIGSLCFLSTLPTSSKRQRCSAIIIWVSREDGTRGSRDRGHSGKQGQTAPGEAGTGVTQGCRERAARGTRAQSHGAQYSFSRLPFCGEKSFSLAMAKVLVCQSRGVPPEKSHFPTSWTLRCLPTLTKHCVLINVRGSLLSCPVSWAHCVSVEIYETMPQTPEETP